MTATIRNLTASLAGTRRRVPLVQQSETADCPLACLTMIAQYHGHDVDLASMRRRCSTSVKGANLGALMAMAASTGFATRPLRLELDDLAKLKVPCVLHWNMDHFVVLTQVKAGRVTIHDPAAGVRVLSLADVSPHFTGVALELTPKADFAPLRERQQVTLSGLVGRPRGIGRALATVLGLALAVEGGSMLLPLFSQWVFDRVLVSTDRDLLTLLVLAFGLVCAFQVAFTAARAWTIAWVSNSAYAQLTTNLFAHLLELPLGWFGRRHVGDIVSRFNSLQSIQQTLSTSFAASLLDGVMVIATFALMFAYSAALSGIVVAAFIVYALARWALFGPLRRAQEEQLIHSARAQSEMLESVRGIQAIQLANKGQSRLARYANAVVSSLNRGLRAQRLKIAFDASNQAITGFLRLAIIALGARMVLSGEFSAGMLVAFSAYADQFVSRSLSLVDKLIELRMLGLHTDRIADVALAAPDAGLRSEYHAAVELDPTIELRNVSFRYSDHEPWILKDCSLRIEFGASIAIVGDSGCGKSTLAKIILGLLEVTHGEVLVGGIDIRKLGLERYREIVAAVMQSDELFAGTIADNIAFFDVDANPAKVEMTAQIAAIHNDIVAMPLGYNTLVGDMGSALSGGQKQRVILARAMYRLPKILVMDEATSHLDVRCERQINASIAKSHCTRIIIAHRPETIASADRVVILAGAGIHEGETKHGSIYAIDRAAPEKLALTAASA